MVRSPTQEGRQLGTGQAAAMDSTVSGWCISALPALWACHAATAFHPHKLTPRSYAAAISFFASGTPSW